MVESGVAARAAGELGDAIAGLIMSEAPIEEKKKRRATENALTDILLRTFVMLSNTGLERRI
jgi:hypothetical protein